MTEISRSGLQLAVKRAASNNNEVLMQPNVEAQPGPSTKCEGSSPKASPSAAAPGWAALSFAPALHQVRGELEHVPDFAVARFR